jgi:ABC-type transport system substrate-binding protein
MNTSRYDAVEDLIAQAGIAQGDEARAAAYKAILKKTMTDVPTIPLYGDRLFMAHTEAVAGLQQNSLFTVDTYSVSLKG